MNCGRESRARRDLLSTLSEIARTFSRILWSSLPAPKPAPLEKYTVTRKGTTYLSDLYYIWKSQQAPVYDATFDGKPILIDGKTYNRGLGCKGTGSVMFLLKSRADRFQAIVSLEKTSKEGGQGLFRVCDGDFFSNRVLWDSGQMTTESSAKEVDIELKDVQCLRLVFDGDQMFGNWADARVHTEYK